IGIEERTRLARVRNDLVRVDLDQVDPGHLRELRILFRGLRRIQIDREIDRRAARGRLLRRRLTRGRLLRGLLLGRDRGAREEDVGRTLARLRTRWDECTDSSAEPRA